ncbi:hypothetical protein [Sodaliphilus pleomorphus]|uniref:hypothetical protein n=1 Tax=Sodaliphilus pleomorphus TaxID=2606626 RepID=UPI00240A310C|nr:hypothetical protein [Sodaliphilus pleomorphus]MDD6687799.1 hypothetical protein [Sodaliphilus pleomorphus]
MMKAKAISTLLLYLATLCLAYPATIYKTRYNQYSGLARIADFNPETGEVDNRHEAFDVMLDSTGIFTPAYRYFARIANYHNQEGKSYEIVSGHRKRHVSSTRCGIIFNALNDSNYNAVLVSCHNSHLHDDLLDKRYMEVELVQVRNNKEQVIKSAHIDKNVDMADRLNAIGVDVDHNTVHVLVGNDKLNQLFTVELPAMHNGSHLGLATGPGARVQVERTVLSYKTNDRRIVNTPWTIEKLNLHFARSQNPYEGYWEYLDRDMSDDVLRLGGRYTIALVATATGYDIIYVSGAQVKKSMWTTGMLKGRLEKTIFTDNFKASWIDATLRPIDLDVQAAFESGVILTVKFPVYKSQVRFSKILDR